ncbi:uncharacterized protein [Antedon mediterranea]|uniref:uncharacterized protein n=1 Tax=Antedon mediterranea TaxID=105859 RepID=UPI003AF419A8
MASRISSLRYSSIFYRCRFLVPQSSSCQHLRTCRLMSTENSLEIKIKSSDTPETLLNVIQENKLSGNQASLSLTRVIQLQNAIPQVDTFTKDPIFEELCNQITKEKYKISTESLVLSLINLCQIKTKSVMSLILMLEPECRRRLRLMQVRHLIFFIINHGALKAVNCDKIDALVAETADMLESRLKDVVGVKNLVQLLIHSPLVSTTLPNKLERHMVSLMDYFSFSDLTKFCEAMVINKFPTGVLLKTMSFKMTSIPEEWSVNQIYEVLKCFDALGFKNRSVIMAFSKFLRSEIANCALTDVINIANMFSRLRMSNIEFLAEVEKFIGKQIASVSFRDLRNVLQAFFVLRFVPSEEFVDTLTKELLAGWLDLKPYLQLELAWCMMGLNILPKVLLEKVVQLNTDDFSPGLATKFQHLLNYAKMETSSNLQSLVEKDVNLRHIQQSVNLRPIQQSVMNTLIDVINKQHISTNVVTPSGHVIDFQILLDDHKMSVDPTQSEQAPSRLAILVHGPTSYLNAGEMFVGPVKMKRKQLTDSGYILTEIGYREWYAMKTEVEKKQFIKKKLENDWKGSLRYSRTSQIRMFGRRGLVTAKHFLARFCASPTLLSSTCIAQQQSYFFLFKPNDVRWYCAQPWLKLLPPAINDPRFIKENSKVSEKQVVPVDEGYDYSVAILEGIHASETIEDIFQAFREIGSYMNEIHIARAVARLAEMSQSLQIEPVTNAELKPLQSALIENNRSDFTFICQLVLKFSVHMDSELFLLTLNSLQVLGLPVKSSLVQTLLTQSSERFNDFNPEEMKQYVNILTKMSKGQSADNLVETLLDSCVVLVDKFTENSENIQQITSVLLNLHERLTEQKQEKLLNKLLAVIVIKNNIEFKSAKFILNALASLNKTKHPIQYKVLQFLEENFKIIDRNSFTQLIYHLNRCGCVGPKNLQFFTSNILENPLKFSFPNLIQISGIMSSHRFVNIDFFNHVTKMALEADACFKELQKLAGIFAALNLRSIVDLTKFCTKLSQLALTTIKEDNLCHDDCKLICSTTASLAQLGNVPETLLQFINGDQFQKLLLNSEDKHIRQYLHMLSMLTGSTYLPSGLPQVAHHQSTEVQDLIRSVLNEIIPGKCIECNVPCTGHVLINLDFLIEGLGNGSPRKTCLLIAPFSYFAFESSHLIGLPAVKENYLKNQGYCVIWIPVHKLELMKSTEEKRIYLKEIVKDALAY